MWEKVFNVLGWSPVIILGLIVLAAFLSLPVKRAIDYYFKKKGEFYNEQFKLPGKTETKTDAGARGQREDRIRKKERF